MIWVIIGNVVMALAVMCGPSAHAPRPSDLDLRRCYLQPVTTRDSVFSHRHLVCWPKDGCFVAPGGDALCWRIATVTPR